MYKMIYLSFTHRVNTWTFLCLWHSIKRHRLVHSTSNNFISTAHWKENKDGYFGLVNFPVPRRLNVMCLQIQCVFWIRCAAVNDILWFKWKGTSSAKWSSLCCTKETAQIQNSFLKRYFAAICNSILASD